MDNVYYITDEPKDVGLLSLIHRGYYRTLDRVHLNIFEGKELTFGLENDVIAKEVAEVFIAPILLEAGVVTKDEHGKFSTPYASMEVRDPGKNRDALIASMEHNVRDMVRQARTLSDDDWRRSSAYMFRRGCAKTVAEAVEKIGEQLRIVFNAPLNDDDSKNTRIEIAFMGLRELKDD